jgi:hypothetical protein
MRKVIVLGLAVVFLGSCSNQTYIVENGKRRKPKRYEVRVVESKGFTRQQSCSDHW